MKFDEYQEETNKTAIYPKDNISGLDYLSLGLVGEAGEVANKVKKVIRDNDRHIGDIVKDLDHELGDILWYIAQICEALGLSMELTAEHNLDKLSDRKRRGKIKGSGDER